MCDRRLRNMLPCTGDISMGEVWMRTADWRRILANMSSAKDPGKADDLKLLLTCYQSMLRRQLVRDTRDVLVESHCGSCGLARAPRHALSAEHGVLSTHHSTAPAMKVSALDALFALLFLLVGLFLGLPPSVHNAPSDSSVL